jgi:dTDP-4-dehydrorhamnose reductase
MKVLIIGGTGMLGHKLVQSLGSTFEVWATIRRDFLQVKRFDFYCRNRTLDNVNLAQEEDLRRAIDRAQPDIVINAAGIIKQLPSATDVITTLSINAILPHRLSQLSAEYGFRLICISTDCVFSGKKGGYTEDDQADASDLYGRSKNLGEVVGEKALSLRTSIIGRELETSNGLVEWFLNNRGGKVKGYSNVIYSGFPTIVFADIISNLLIGHPDLSGIYHVSSAPINKFDLLNLINKHYKSEIKVERDNELNLDRTLDSTRFRDETGFKPVSWDEMIRRMAIDPTPYNEWRK